MRKSDWERAEDYRVWLAIALLAIVLLVGFIVAQPFMRGRTCTGYDYQQVCTDG